MKRQTRYLILGVSLFAASAAMADVTFFETENFGGRQFRVDRPAANFGAMGFNDRSQSAIVEGGSWEICGDYNFGGGCTVLAPGRYPNLGGWNGRVSSARPLNAPAPAMPPPPVVTTPATGGTVMFYENDNFSGRRFAVNQVMPNFGGTGFNDRARSAIVEGGPWEICVDAEFRGDCRIFVPGRYPDLGGLGGRASSARPSYASPVVRNVEPRDRARWASATLYSGPNMTGRPFALGSEGTSNLDGLFNDRASSLRVDRGYWIFCSDADFRGECRTFGPGEYPVLPPDLDRRISSGRRISHEYPYGTQPYWR
ncbi:MAG: beta/gamma crystallin-related protein [Acidobacteriota bacterium]